MLTGYSAIRLDGQDPDHLVPRKAGSCDQTISQGYCTTVWRPRLAKDRVPSPPTHTTPTLYPILMSYHTPTQCTPTIVDINCGAVHSCIYHVPVLHTDCVPVPCVPILCACTMCAYTVCLYYVCLYCVPVPCVPILCACTMCAYTVCLYYVCLYCVPILCACTMYL